MALSRKTTTLRIGGMVCANCRKRIERKLRATPGVHSAHVDYAAGTASITHDAGAEQSIRAAIEGLGYETSASGRARAAGVLVVIVALYILLEQSGVLNMLAPSRLANATMGYTSLLVLGLLTSVHCVAMCGGLNLSQCIPSGAKTGPLRSAFLYNLGRVASYTAVGFVVGALGSALTFSNAMQGALKLAAGVFMVVMGINMLGIFPWLGKALQRVSNIFARKDARSTSADDAPKRKSPLIVGLLNGFMPCGPLQAMQIYALSTGNPFDGALSMFLFAIGTVPLMFGLGALASALGGKFTRTVMTAGAALVVVLGMSMFTQGFSLSGVDAMPQAARRVAAAQDEATLRDGVQVVNSTLSRSRYPNITVSAGTPVRWVIDAPQGSISGCNSTMFINEYGLEHTFTSGENVIEFTPSEAGTFRYSCWMGMIRATITVV